MNVMQVDIGENKVLTQISSEPYWIVCQAESKTSGERVWFKILSQDLYSDSELVERFHESARISTLLRHPNILTYYEHGLEEGLHVIAIEPFEGTQLNDLLTAENQLPVDRAVHIIAQIAKALQHAHINGVLHGALNPYSIYVDHNDFVKVLNFGSFRLMQHLLHTKREKAIVPLAHYISPEQANPKAVVDGRSDIYSLGILFYRMVTGKLPYTNRSLNPLLQAHKKTPIPSPRYITPNIPEHIENIIQRQLDKDRNNRYSSCTSLLHELLPDYKEELEGEEKPESWILGLKSDISVWISDNIIDRFKIFSPTLVGSKRRLAIASMFISIFITVVFLITLFSGLWTRSPKNDLNTYLDQISDQTTNQDLPDLTESDTTEEQIDDNGITESASDDTILLAQNLQPSIETTESDENSSPQTTNITPARQETQPVINRPVIPQYGSLVVYAMADSMPTSATIYLDGRNVGQTNGRNPVRIPRVTSNTSHVLRVLKPGYISQQVRIRVGTNQEHVESVTLNPQLDVTKRFTFRQVTFADRIIINNQGMSRPLPCEINLSAGKHKLVYIDSESGYTWETEMSLDMNSPEEIYFESKDIGEGTLSVIIKNPAQFGYAYVLLNDDRTLDKTTPFRTQLPIGRHTVKVTREGLESLPSDTTVFVKLNQETNVVFELVAP